MMFCCRDNLLGFDRADKRQERNMYFQHDGSSHLEVREKREGRSILSLSLNLTFARALKEPEVEICG